MGNASIVIGLRLVDVIRPFVEKLEKPPLKQFLFRDQIWIQPTHCRRTDRQTQIDVMKNRRFRKPSSQVIGTKGMKTGNVIWCCDMVLMSTPKTLSSSPLYTEIKWSRHFLCRLLSPRAHTWQHLDSQNSPKLRSINTYSAAFCFAYLFITFKWAWFDWREALLEGDPGTKIPIDWGFGEMARLHVRDGVSSNWRKLSDWIGELLEHTYRYTWSYVYSCSSVKGPQGVFSGIFSIELVQSCMKPFVCFNSQKDFGLLLTPCKFITMIASRRHEGSQCGLHEVLRLDACRARTSSSTHTCRR